MEQGMMELVKFNVTDAAIAQMGERYMGLTIKGLEDKEGFKAVHAARIEVKGKRIEVEKTRKELKEEALRYGQAVDKEAKRICALIAPIEDHLQSEEDKIQAEKDRIKAEAEEKERARIQARIDRLEDLGMVLSRGVYVLTFPPVQELQYPTRGYLEAVSEEVFEKYVQDVITAVAAEKERLANIEAARKAEEDRLAEIAMAQEAERKRLEEEAEKQRKEIARIKAEQNQIEAQKRALEAAKQKEIDDRRRAEELEKVKAEAAEKARIYLEKARIEAEEKAKRDAEAAERKRLEAIEKERLAKIAAEEEARIQEELKPDKKKLLELADGIEAIHGPQSLKFEASKKVLAITLENLQKVAIELRQNVKKMKGVK